ncbi:MAG: redoxin domain-containing protein [Proteobacteria bacterium]|nr:redoxin domain-containing protein [Pseudomonadota bacterium]
MRVLLIVLATTLIATSVGAVTPNAAPKVTPKVTPSSAASVAPAEAATPEKLRTILAKERGNVVILNVWGTWCVPCLREIPELVKLQQELASQRVALIGVSMDEASSISSMVEPFRTKFFPEFRTYVRDSPDMDSMVSVVDSAWNEILPTTYILDRQGKVARKIQGVKSYEEFRTIVLAAAATDRVGSTITR